MEFAPIALFVYNRPKHTRATVDALRLNILASESDLFIFSDGAKKKDHAVEIEELRSYLSDITGFKSVTLINREHNYGLAQNIMEGVTEIVNKYNKVIVLEDDLITAPFFLQYMNDGLNMYENDPQVISIEGYLYPSKAKLPETFFIKGADCWGWGTWKRGWDLFEPDGQKLLTRLAEAHKTYEFDYDGAYPFTEMLRIQVEGKISSWAVRWYASAFLNNKYTLYPGRSLVFNAGADGSGTHVGIDDILTVELSTTPIQVTRIKVEQCVKAFLAFSKFHYKVYKPSLLYRAKRYFKKYIAR
jgi:hypothetical protein